MTSDRFNSQNRNFNKMLTSKYGYVKSFDNVSNVIKALGAVYPSHYTHRVEVWNRMNIMFNAYYAPVREYARYASSLATPWAQETIWTLNTDIWNPFQFLKAF